MCSSKWSEDKTKKHSVHGVDALGVQAHRLIVVDRFELRIDEDEQKVMKGSRFDCIYVT